MSEKETVSKTEESKKTDKPSTDTIDFNNPDYEYDLDVSELFMMILSFIGSGS
jgi:hypothetical protein